MLYSGCEGLGCARWLVLGLLLIGCTVGIGSAVAITGPVVIEKPGTYELTKDIIGTKAVVGIEIRCDNVVLDGKGHRIKGVDAANSAGVLIHGSGPVTNVHIRNLVTEEEWRGVTVPIFIILAPDDNPDYTTTGERIAELAADVRTLTIEKVKHWAHYEAPEIFNPANLAFLLGETRPG